MSEAVVLRCLARSFILRIMSLGSQKVILRVDVVSFLGVGVTVDVDGLPWRKTAFIEESN